MSTLATKSVEVAPGDSKFCSRTYFEDNFEIFVNFTPKRQFTV